MTATSSAADAATLRTGDAEQWREVTEWKERITEDGGGALAPLRDTVGEVRSFVQGGLRRVPGVAQLDDVVHDVLHQLAAAGAGAGAATLRRESVFARYRALGHDVADFKDIRKLDVGHVQEAMPRLDLAYPAVAGLQGGTTSLLLTTGASAATGGAGLVGLGGLPGIAVIVGSLTGDALLTVAACTRAVAHVGAYYGYDVTKRSEQVLALAILAVGLSSDADAPEAYEEVASLIASREKDKEKKKRQQRQMRRLARAVHQRLLSQIGQRELAQLVPVVGVGIGAVLSARLLARVVDAAEHLYRERFLHEKYEIPFSEEPPEEILAELG
ncbi:EcsC family protein [Actinomycetospora sp. TBRC 11914]|uniref:EcsC family protein n=1 Tax=Actinomycetospora sp. TBRC 11914 TaxID=2729387 RepID=UPI00145D6BE4|nr:EcsC family protein [Actinomycetospora sp. TBRC 11914]NMO91979.1 EcsC family protein [Actinomycetospora sp. TBRC 11914]